MPHPVTSHVARHYTATVPAGEGGGAYNRGWWGAFFFFFFPYFYVYMQPVWDMIDF